MTPTDPLYDDQWHFALIGDIETIWEDYDGTDVSVGVYDDGVDYDHDDLDDNYDPSLGAVDDLGNPIDGYPALFVPDGDGHGTSVAGIIAGELNGQGGVGIAFGAMVSAVNIFDPGAYGFVNGDTEAFLDVASQAVQFDISQNSWGATPTYSDGLLSEGFAQDLDATYADVSRDGRGGLGTIITQAAGNDDKDANGDGVNVSRFTITVAATDEKGDAAYYSNYGASILITAPAAAVTTDLSGVAGYDPTNYTDEFGGTSAATPVTSGVIALMLDANEGLGWRDVQSILAASARLTGTAFNASKAGLEEEGTWDSNGATTWNGGGYHYHINYGYGMIDVFGAVRMAEVWSLFGAAQVSANEKTVTAVNNFADVDVPDNNATGVTRTVNMNGNLEIEHVQLILDLTSEELMDLRVTLTSAEGTVVVVALEDDMLFNPADVIDGKWVYGIDTLKGELSQGTWTVKVTDLSGNKVTTLNSAEIKVFGSSVSANDVYHFTDEYLKMKGFEGSRSTIKDTNGGKDWLNFAAVTGDVLVNMSGKSNIVVDGKGWGKLSGQFEHVVTGDGKDTVNGNDVNNMLHGMRGNDTLNGGNGADDLYGGADQDKLYGGKSQDELFGNAGNDKLYGDAGNDILDGGAGIDSMSGGVGNDTFIINGKDKLIESEDAGVDKVRSGGSHTLGDNIEQLTLTGTKAVNGTGNALNNSIGGNAAANILKGAGGNDILTGGDGKDVLTGGGGSDTFRFTTALSASNIDTITDFNSGLDEIYLDDAVFKGIAKGTLAENAFAINNSGAASDSKDRIIYEKDTGLLWYDRDGSGNEYQKVKFADLDAKLPLQAEDFFVF